MKSTTLTDLWNNVPCSFIEIDSCFRGAYWLHHQGDECAAFGKLGGRIRAGQTRLKLGQTKG
jgi:hypothetical protein